MVGEAREPGRRSRTTPRSRGRCSGVARPSGARACAGSTPPCARCWPRPSRASFRPAPGLRHDHARRGDPGRARGEGLVHHADAARAREPSQEALESARGVLQAKVAAELRSRHTPQLTFLYDTHPGGRGRPDAASSTRSPMPKEDGDPMSRPRRHARRRWRRCSARPGRALRRRRPPQPRRRRGRLDARPGARPARGRRRTSCWRTPTPARCPSDLAFLLADGEEIAPRPPGRPGRARAGGGRLRQRGAALWTTPVHEGARLVVNIDHHQDNTRFGDLNLIEPDASSTAEVDPGRPRRRPAGRSPATVAEPLYVGLVDRHRPLRLQQHRGPGPPGRGGPDRGRRRAGRASRAGSTRSSRSTACC